MDKLLYDDVHHALRKDRAFTATPQRAVPPSDDELLHKGLAAQLDREPHSIGSADIHQRTEFGTVKTPFGTVVVSHDRGTDSVAIHGVNVATSDLGDDLRQSLIATSAAFSAAETAEEQVSQRNIIALIVGEALRRREWLAAEVKRRLQRQRYE